jgi:flagellar biosynthetic protein FliS
MNPYRAYTSVNTTTASPQRIMMTLLETALGDMRKARAAFERGDYNAGISAGEHAANIVLGLQSTLKTDVAPALCERLDTLYGFIVGRLVVACGKSSARFAEEAERVFAPLVGAFGEAVAREGAARSDGGVQP